MSNPTPDINAAFKDIVGGLDVDWAPVTLETLPVDGQAVQLDKELGESFRQAVLDEYQTMQADLVALGAPDDETVPVEKIVTDELLRRTMRADFPLLHGTRLLVRGTGLITIEASGEYRPWSALPDMSVSGNLWALAYMPYYHAAELRTRNSDVETSRIEMKTGLVLALGDVVMCETSGMGMVDGRTDMAIVPLGNKNLDFYVATAA